MADALDSDPPAGRGRELVTLNGDLKDRRARELLPYPAAVRLRAATIAERPRDRYDATLRAAEAMVAVMATSYLVAYGATPSSGAGVARWREDLAKGVAFGSWLAVLRSLAGSSPSPTSLAQAGQSVMRDALKAADALVHERNQTAHGAPVTDDAEALERLSGIDGELQRLIRGGAFLADQQWVIADRSSRRRDGTYEIDVRDMTGDHPEFERRSLRLREPLIDGDVYIVDRETAEALPATPFCLLLRCKECRNQEIYLPSKWKRDLEYRSVDRGHIAPAPPEIAELLAERAPVQPASPAPQHDDVPAPHHDLAPTTGPSHTATAPSAPRMTRHEGWSDEREGALVDAAIAYGGRAAGHALRRLLDFSRARGAGPTFGAGRFPSVAVWFTVEGYWVSVWSCFARTSGPMVEINFEYLAKRGISRARLEALARALERLPCATSAVGAVVAKDFNGRAPIPLHPGLDAAGAMDQLLTILGDLVDG